MKMRQGQHPLTIDSGQPYPVRRSAIRSVGIDRTGVSRWLDLRRRLAQSHRRISLSLAISFNKASTSC
jgi:hypothetical protein